MAYNNPISFSLVPREPEEIEVSLSIGLQMEGNLGLGEQNPRGFADIKETHKAMAQGYSMVKGL